MRIQHNIPALNSHRNLGINNSQTSKNLEKLSSGYRINRAGDDAAGLAISEKMRGQIRGLAQAEQNTSMGINLIQTAEGGLNETHAILQRMRELAVQSSNGTFQDGDRVQLTHEFDALKEEIDRIATSTHYNGIQLLDGSLSNNTVAGPNGAAGKISNVTESTAGMLVGDVTVGSNTSLTSGSVTGAITSTTTVTTDKTSKFDIDISATSVANVDNKFDFSFGGKSYTTAAPLATADAAGLAAAIAAAINADKPTGFTGTIAATGAKITFTSGNINAPDTTFDGWDISGLTQNGGTGSSTGVGSLKDTAGAVIGSTAGNTTTYSISFDGGTTQVSGVVNGTEVTFDDSTGTGLKLTVDTSKLTGTGDQVALDFAAKTSSAVAGEGLIFQIGANGTEDQRVALNVDAMDSYNIGATVSDTDFSMATGKDLRSSSIDTRANANAAIDIIDGATNMVSAQRAKLGALQNRLEHTMNNLGVTKENLTASESTIRDVDMAKEMMEFTKNNILVQASQAMLAQANQLPQGVLQLLR